MQWQSRILGRLDSEDNNTLCVQYAPRAYDPQKATRITLFHAVLTFTLARIWIATTDKPDPKFSSLINRLRIALGKSKYLDGHKPIGSSSFGLCCGPAMEAQFSNEFDLWVDKMIVVSWPLQRDRRQGNGGGQVGPRCRFSRVAVYNPCLMNSANLCRLKRAWICCGVLRTSA